MAGTGKRSGLRNSVRTVTLVGAGNLAHALAPNLLRAGYAIEAVIVQEAHDSISRARSLAKKVGARARSIQDSPISSGIVWLCVPDAAISGVAGLLAKTKKRNWRGKIALHSSGAFTSDEIVSLRRRGASVASLHPLMTFVKGSKVSLVGVPFAIEGDSVAVRRARQIVKDLGGQAYSVRKQDKVAYHAWATFASPLLTALLATTERVAAAAEVSAKAARRRILPIVAQTITNYVAHGAAGGFSGPIVRGDVEVVRRHLRALRAIPEAREVYIALARAAVKYLPGKNRETMRKALDNS
jgi:predicted short-subunit dehydrogenase-like oxidoreductase (DUF2520 family)